MESIIHGALDEICTQAAKGLTLTRLWSKINNKSHVSSSNLKQALWSSLLNIPTLQFQRNGVPYDAQNPSIQSFQDAEAMDLKIVAAEHMLNSFVGMYDIEASDAGVSEDQRRVLERLALARTDGVTQNDLTKELDKKSNDIFYILKTLETRGLIVRQSTIIRKKEAGNEEYTNGSIVNTNMLYLYCYAKHLGHLQRLEITKGVTDNDNAAEEVGTGTDVSEERVNNYGPAFTAICDRLEKADRKVMKVLVASDIKRELGYCNNKPAHRAWRNFLNKLQYASIVEEFTAKVNNKVEVTCVRLLKKFSPENFMPKEQQVKRVKRGQITEQLLELPIEQQIYDMIDAEGSKGLTYNEVCKRLGIDSKGYDNRFQHMKKRFRMHLNSEALKRGVVNRVWTCGNYNAGVPYTEKPPTYAQAGQLMLTHTIQDADYQASNMNAEVSEEQGNAEATDVFPDAEPQIVTVKPSLNPVSLERSPSGSPAPRRRRSYTTYPCIGLNTVKSLREQRILEKLQEEKLLIKPELQRLLESIENLEKKQSTRMDRKTLERSLNKLQQDGHCKCISFAIPSLTNIVRKHSIDVVLHPSVYEAADLSDRVHDRIRLFEKQIRTQAYSKLKTGKSNKSIPVLNDVERINTSLRIDTQSEYYEAMKKNGFVLAKMVRAKLLHVFFWGHLTGLSGWDDAIKDGHEQKNPHSSCKLFELDAAIKAMPLKLFLQVAGSNLQLKSVVEKCKKGLRLSDLPVHEYRCLMDTRATGRLSYLVDILRRLKLIRLIGGDIPVGPHTTLRHSFELKPYIEEPVGIYKGINASDLRPQARHDFVLSSKKSVDEYWNTLEHCYAASDPTAALHAFPGSTVKEVYHVRSWTSVRVMTAHQRDELLKLVANEDVSKNISFRKCEKIAESLNLTLEQVIRVFYDKRNKLKVAARAKEHEFPALKDAPFSCTINKSSKRRSPLNNENSLDEDSRRLKQAKSANNATKEQSSSHR
ncbi:uncharacterized protein LOC143621593 [Bidens hawaiensis]|uniref:uncharacterized protein LOC143621593 n=1 Tax=Bidens hawaiensis TaxID=980011 RepID=UPI00404A20C0